MYDLFSFSTSSYKQENGQSEFTEIIHISTYYVYKRLFPSSPSENVCSPTIHASVYLN